MKIYCDGFTIRGNPSSEGGGFTLVREDTKLLKTEEILRPNFTNNEAELLGVVAALEMAKDDDIVVTDSKVILIWITAGFAKARPDLNHLCQKAHNLSRIKKVVWEPRETNLAGHYNEMFH